MTGNYSNLPIIAIISPFACAFIIGLIGERKKAINIQRILALIAAFISVVCIFMMFKPIMLDKGILSYWMGDWIPEKSWAIGIGLEVDSFGLFTAIIISTACFLSCIYSIRYMERDNALSKYYVLFLLLTGSMIGFVLTGDLFNMYVMLEIMTFAAIALTAFRNDVYKSLEAGFKYIVIGSLGSSLILIGTALLYAELHTLNLAQIAALLHGNYTPVNMFALALLLTGYGVKAFLVPCHTWPPDAHMAAPSSISMLLSGIMSKTGVYALIRILYMLYQSMGLSYMEFLIVFWGTITMFVGVTMALIQTDFKRLLAFHSVSQIGYVMTGFGIGLHLEKDVAVLGTMGGLYHMFNHATFKSLLFLSAGAVLYAAGTTDLDKLGGLGRKMPHTCALFLIGALSISGLPPFNGFVSKWLIYQATYEAGYVPVTIVALVVSVMTLASFVKVAQSVFFGQQRKELENVKEVPLLMRIPMGILAFICIVAGVIPEFVEKYLIKPAAYSIYNIGSYLDTMFGAGYAERMFKEKVALPETSVSKIGYWRPEYWLVLLIVIIIALLIIFVINPPYRNIVSDNECKSKFEVFTGGEKQEFSKVGAHDLFWGLKHDLRGYFSTISEAHSGVVNDYVLWVISCLSIICIYLFVFF